MLVAEPNQPRGIGLWVRLCLLILDKMGWSQHSQCVLNTGVQETNHKTVFVRRSGDLVLDTVNRLDFVSPLGVGMCLCFRFFLLT